jgi:hypothetical protein
MDTFITRLIIDQRQANSSELVQISAHIVAAPFANDLLEVDEPLWGGFWQGDVLAPGYCLPAVELALLRAVRLDGHWPEETTIPQFLADLRQAMAQPQTGVWILTVAGTPCVVLAAPPSTQHSKVIHTAPLTVAWYCPATGRLHAGYRAAMETLDFTGAVELRGLVLGNRLKSSPNTQPDWIEQAVAQKRAAGQQELASQLDLAILQRRGKIV